MKEDEENDNFSIESTLEELKPTKRSFFKQTFFTGPKLEKPFFGPTCSFYKPTSWDEFIGKTKVFKLKSRWSIEAPLLPLDFSVFDNISKLVQEEIDNNIIREIRRASNG